MRSLLHKSNSTLKKCFPTLKSSCLWLSSIRSTANLLFSIFLWYFSCPLLSYHSHHSLHRSAAQRLTHFWLPTDFHIHSHTWECREQTTKICPPDWKVQDLRAGPPHVTGHFNQLLLQRVCVLGQLVQAEGPVCPSCVQLGLHCLWEDKAKGSASR